MELREHPGMQYRSIPNWPPVWVRSRTSAAEYNIIRGEVGVLEEVLYRQSDQRPRCHLVIEHLSQRLLGTLLFDDAVFCALLVKALRSRIGWSIKELGDLDLPRAP